MIENRCSVCAMTREQRGGYPDQCPLNFPEGLCPSYDRKKGFPPVKPTPPPSRLVPEPYGNTALVLVVLVVTILVLSVAGQW
jgi:hypothetical protein